MGSTFPLSNRSSTCREGGQFCVIILSNRVVRQYRACVVDLLGLGIHVWCVLLYYVYNPSRSCLPSFCANPIFHLSLLFLCSVMIVEGILCIRFVHMCVTDSIVRKCVPVKDRVIGKFITHSSVLCYESA